MGNKMVFSFFWIMALTHTTKMASADVTVIQRTLLLQSYKIFLEIVKLKII